MRQLDEGLDRLGSRMQRRSQCAVVLVHTHLWSLNVLHPFRRHYAAVRDRAEARGFHVVDTHPPFLGRLMSNALHYWVAQNDSHPNAKGHELFSQALWAGLEQLPAECWESRNARTRRRR